MQDKYIPIPYAIPGAYAFNGKFAFTAGVIESDGRTCTVGSFLDYRFALQCAHEYALDMARIPHARANRPLSLQDLRELTDAQLETRRRFLRTVFADKMTRAQNHAQNALISRVQNERARKTCSAPKQP